jgi:hypothetical protein
VLHLLEKTMMSTLPLPHATPVNIDQLESGKAYFSVGVCKDNSMFLDYPFCFVEVFTRLDERNLPVLMISQKQLDDFPRPMCHLDSHASGLGLLVGTDHNSRFGDNYWRTFLYSKEAYRYFQEIVDAQDMTKYQSIVGKRIPLSAEEHVQLVWKDAVMGAMKQMEFK